MPDLARPDRAAHLGPAFRDEFGSWQELRAYAADQVANPGFSSGRALQQLLYADLAHRITAASGHGWFLRGSLALPARPPSDLPLPDAVRAFGHGTGVDPVHAMARPANDLDLCATGFPELALAAATTPADRLAETVRQVVDTRPEPGIDHGFGLGGLVHYHTTNLRTLTDGRVVADIDARPIDPRGRSQLTVVDEPVTLRVDLSPPGAAPFDGPPEPAHRPTHAMDAPGFARYLPDLSPTAHQLAEKLCTISVPRNADQPPPDYHRYKDLVDAYYLISTSEIDAGQLRRAIAANPQLAQFGLDELPSPYRLYGHQPGPDATAVNWQKGYRKLRAEHPVVRDYPDLDDIVAAVAEFADERDLGGHDRVWLPRHGWVSREMAPQLVQADRIRQQTSRLTDAGDAHQARQEQATSNQDALTERRRREPDNRTTGREGPGLRR